MSSEQEAAGGTPPKRETEKRDEPVRADSGLFNPSLFSALVNPHLDDPWVHRDPGDEDDGGS